MNKESNIEKQEEKTYPAILDNPDLEKIKISELMSKLRAPANVALSRQMHVITTLHSKAVDALEAALMSENEAIMVQGIRIYFQFLSACGVKFESVSPLSPDAQNSEMPTTFTFEIPTKLQEK